jgi:hypothetical protein
MVANTLNLFRDGAVGFIDWLGPAHSHRFNNRFRNSAVHKHHDANEIAASTALFEWRFKLYHVHEV